MWKSVVEMPKLKLYFFCSSFMARIVSFAFSKPRFTRRTWLCISPTPSIDTRVLKMTPRSWHISTIFVSIGMPRWGVSPVVLMPELPQPGQPIEHDPADLDEIVAGRRLAAGNIGVLDVLPEVRLEGLVDLGEGHVALAVAALPVAAHLAARIADERAVENHHGGVDGVVAGDIAVDDIAGGADRRLGEILQRVDLCHKVLILNLLWPAK